MKASRASAALQARTGRGVLAVVQEQQTVDRLQGICRDMQLDDELVINRHGRRRAAAHSLGVTFRGFCSSTLAIFNSADRRGQRGPDSRRAELKIVALGALNGRRPVPRLARGRCQ